MKLEQIDNRLRLIENSLRPAACFLGGMELANKSHSVNCPFEPARDAYTSIIRSGIDISDLRKLIKRELDCKDYGVEEEKDSES